MPQGSASSSEGPSRPKVPGDGAAEGSGTVEDLAMLVSTEVALRKGSIEAEVVAWAAGLIRLLWSKGREEAPSAEALEGQSWRRSNPMRGPSNGRPKARRRTVLQLP